MCQSLKKFANNASADMKLPKTSLSKIVQSGECLGRFLDPLIRVDL